jgi:hypothetical protein
VRRAAQNKCQRSGRAQTGSRTRRWQQRLQRRWQRRIGPSQALRYEHSEPARSQHTNGTRGVSRCGAVRLIQKPLQYKGIHLGLGKIVARARVWFTRYLIVVPRLTFAAALVGRRRYLIVVPRPILVAPHRYLILVLNQLPAAPLVERSNIPAGLSARVLCLGGFTRPFSGYLLPLAGAPALCHHGRNGYQPFSLVPNPDGSLV